MNAQPTRRQHRQQRLVPSGVQGLALLLMVFLLAACWPSRADRPTETADWPRVARAVDGDTLVLDDGTRVRLLGVNTPERGQPFYEEAKAFTEQLTLDQPVRLEQDVVPVDRYNRLLAYVYLADGTFVNLEIIRQGYGQVYIIPPNVAYADEFRQAEREARQAQRGLWELSRTRGFTLRIVNLVADAPGADAQNLNGEWVEIENVGSQPVQLRGYTLSDTSNTQFVFPDLVLAPGERVRVYTGQGTPSPGALYWGRSRPVWNNSGDTAYLRAPDGTLVDLYTYEP